MNSPTSSVLPVIPLWLQAQIDEGVSSGAFEACVLFVDIKGFTPLTESLMQRGKEGAEILSSALNDVFAPMVDLVYASGGFIPYFAGDAFFGVFPSALPSSVATVAFEALDAFDQRPPVGLLPGAFQIEASVGLSAGTVNWGVVGPGRIAYYKGAALTRAADAQKRAALREIVADDFFIRSEPVFPFSTEIRTAGFYRLIGITDSNRATATFAVKSAVPSSDFSAGEFRSVASVFISFEGIEKHDSISEFATVVLNQFGRFGGYFKEFDFGDKGALAVGFFGAPVAYEDDAERALECMLALGEALGELQKKIPFRFRVGAAAGVAFAGKVGGKERRQYAAVGDRVNLAARMALQAPWSAIYVNAQMRVDERFSFAPLGSLRYKGMATPVETYQLTGRKEASPRLFAGKIIGREKELSRLTGFARDFSDGIKAAFIFGEAGVGKSRLLYEFRAAARETPSTWASCLSDQMLQKPFNPFFYFLRTYFQQSTGVSPQENKKNFESIFARLVAGTPAGAEAEKKELERTQSALAAALGLYYKESLWERLDAKGRYENTFAALSSFLLGLSARRPLILEMDDAHWMDENSKAFLEFFIQKAVGAPVLLIVAARYSEEGSQRFTPSLASLSAASVPVEIIDLNILTRDGLTELAEARLKGAVAEDFAGSLWRATNGNPFFAEQMLAYYSENSLLEKVGDRFALRYKDAKISTSIRAVVTARLDRLPETVKETVKDAAVIGIEFELGILSEAVHPTSWPPESAPPMFVALKDRALAAERLQIWSALAEWRYAFRHVLVREAAYDMQPRARLRRQHARVAAAIEKIYAHRLETKYADLVFHYEQAEDLVKTIFYLKRAADYARKNYQNQQALDFYERLYPYIVLQGNAEEIIRLLLYKGKILQVVGRWAESVQHFEEALQRAPASGGVLLKGAIANALGGALTLRGAYAEARRYLQEAAGYFEGANDPKGVSAAYGALGDLYFRQGEYERARQFFTQSERINQREGFASAPQMVSMLGLTYMNLGDYAEAVSVQSYELRRCEERNDRLGMALLCINLGIVHLEWGDENQALAYYEKGLELARELGARQLISIVTGCIGNVWRLKGDFEKALFFLEEDVQICRELGDRQGLAIVAELLGKLFMDAGDSNTAKAHFESSLEGARDLHYQKGCIKALQGLGAVYLYLGEPEEAAAYLDEAVALSRSIGARLLLVQCLLTKGAVCLTLGDPASAAAAGREAALVAPDLGNERLTREAVAFAARFTPPEPKA